MAREEMLNGAKSGHSASLDNPVEASGDRRQPNRHAACAAATISP